MNATNTAHELDITDLYFPRSADSRTVDWAEMQNDEGMFDEDHPSAPTYTYTEAFDFEYGTETYGMITRDGYAVAVIVEGHALEASDLENERDEAAEEAEADGRDAAEDSAYRAWDARLDALAAAQDDSPSQWGAEGPMMNYFYPVSDYTPGDMEEWAAKIADLPLCVVEIDGERGLALTGGGMDLSWEIAEAFIRLGYYPPTWIDLPAMSGRGESEKDRAIATALATHYRAEVRRLERRISEISQRYGPIILPTD